MIMKPSSNELVVFPTVYEPAEDSLLLVKYSKDLKGKILEIGCGCGLQSLTNARTNPTNQVLGVDLNPNAVENSLSNANKLGLKNVKFIQSNLFSKVKGKFNAIIFNPPYLPTSKEEKLKDAENLAYDGGEDGRKTLDKFLNQFEKFLEPNGILLLVQSSLNNLERTKKIFSSKGFSIEILDQESFFFEKIYVLRIKRILK